MLNKKRIFKKIKKMNKVLRKILIDSSFINEINQFA